MRELSGIHRGKVIATGMVKSFDFLIANRGLMKVEDLSREVEAIRQGTDALQDWLDHHEAMVEELEEPHRCIDLDDFEFDRFAAVGRVW